jgi:TetR/AcrR family transcriptional regulator, transcriptional repressor for nem operon
MAVRKNGGTDTAAAILDVAERMVQTRGFNAFSYGDVATELGITRPALHYHFPGKAELGQALLVRYTTRFGDALQAIDAGTEGAALKLERYVDLYGQVLAQDRMCLCGMLASDYHTLPESMRQAVTSFFDQNQSWVAGVLEEGRADGSLRVEGETREAAEMIIGALEGGMLLARTYRDPDRFAVVARRLLAQTAAPHIAT